MEPLKWSSEPPTVAGWYRVRDLKGGPEGMAWWEPGDPVNWIEWAGPMPEPAEPE